MENLLAERSIVSFLTLVPNSSFFFNPPSVPPGGTGGVGTKDTWNRSSGKFLYLLKKTHTRFPQSSKDSDIEIRLYDEFFFRNPLSINIGCP